VWHLIQFLKSITVNILLFSQGFNVLLSWFCILHFALMFSWMMWAEGWEGLGVFSYILVANLSSLLQLLFLTRI